jgi:Protein of unknown function (DUF3575).
MFYRLFIIGIIVFAFQYTNLMRAQEQVFPQKKMPVFTVKSNLLYDLTSTVNVGAELRIRDNFSIDFPVNYNGWTYSNNKKFKHFLIQPELRYWPYRFSDGHFLGFHTHYGYYNTGGLNLSDYMKKHRFEGWLTGVGFSYGYYKKLSDRWALEVSLGVGYAFLDYDIYRCESCGEKTGTEAKNYIGITKPTVSLIYVIK